MQPPPLLTTAAAIAAVAAVAGAQTQPSKELAEVAAAYAAKITASALFVSGRTLDSVLAEELAPTRPLEALIRPLLRFDVDEKTRSVTCRLGAATATATTTRGLGCTLVVNGVDAASVRARGTADAKTPSSDPELEWPRGERVAPPAEGTLADALKQALDAAFAERPGHPPVNTRAVVVVHRGRIVAERYAPGYDARMALPGWSMTKTIANALVGLRVGAGALDADAELPVPEWRTRDDDPRRAIRLTHLLQMSAGLSWNESYDDPASDALRMLFRSSDHAAAFAQQPVAHAPGEVFAYASGATNLLCRIVRTTFADDAQYHAFPARALFGPLGMRTAVLETDPSGTFVGSSYGFASARDWARFGLLFAQDGVFDGKRVLPEGWVKRSTTPSPASGGRYGSQIWLNADPDGDGSAQAAWPDVPTDLVRMDGHEGQYTIVMPKDEIVIVRLGCTKSGGFDVHGLARNVHRACAAGSAAARER